MERCPTCGHTPPDRSKQAAKWEDARARAKADGVSVSQAARMLKCERTQYYAFEGQPHAKGGGTIVYRQTGG